MDLKDKWRNLVRTATNPGRHSRGLELTEQQRQDILKAVFERTSHLEEALAAPGAAREWGVDCCPRFERAAPTGCRGLACSAMRAKQLSSTGCGPGGPRPAALFSAICGAGCGARGAGEALPCCMHRREVPGAGQRQAHESRTRPSMRARRHRCRAQAPLEPVGRQRGAGHGRRRFVPGQRRNRVVTAPGRAALPSARTARGAGRRSEDVHIAARASQ